MKFDLGFLLRQTHGENEMRLDANRLEAVAVSVGPSVELALVS